MHKWLWSIDFLPGERGNWLSVSWLLTSLGEGRSQGQAGSAPSVGLWVRAALGWVLAVSQ